MMTQLIVAGIALAVAFAGGWTVRNWKAGADEAARLEQMVKDYDTVVNNNAEASKALEKSLGKLRPIYRTINNEVQREVVENTVYRDCVVTADGVRIINRAVQAANNPGQPDSPVPVTVIPPRQSNDGRPPLP
jgi:hypothetical protein